MQHITRILALATVISFAACGGGNGNADLKAKKDQLEKLKKQQGDIAAEIVKTEAAIAKLDPASAKVEKTKLVSLTSVAPQVFTHFIDLQGKVEAVNISYVTARNGGGQVKVLYVKKGDVVRKGQLLLKLDDVIAQKNVAAAQRNLDNAKIQLAFQKDLYQKQKNLWDQQIGTEVQLITAKNNVDTYENQVKLLQEQLKIAEEQLDFSNVYSDVDGIADDVNIRVGETFTGVVPGTGNPQIKIVNTTNLKATAQVPENYLGRVNVGNNVKIAFPDINKALDVKVTVASNLIDPNNRSFYIEAKLPASKDFRPNQIALVKIQDYTTPNALTVPVNTLQSDEKGKYVMVAVKEGNKLIAKKKTVTIGELYGDTLEIKSGLQAGDQVITDGYQGLYEGQVLTTS
ncbi:efflux RND transporter periplasmic adaptor subunit [Chitinophagaceae bacterium LWZ2-11]